MRNFASIVTRRSFHPDICLRRLLPLMMAVLIAVMSLCSSCRREDRLPVFRWSSAGDDFDTITLRMERDFNNFASPDIILSHIHGMDSLSRLPLGADTMRLRLGRVMYWRARFAGRYINDRAALILVRQALSIIDSTLAPYDRRRTQALLLSYSDTIGGAEEYAFLTDNIDYAQRLNDKPFELQLRVLLGNLFADIGENEKALINFNICDSLARECGLWKIPVKDSINRASVIRYMGHREKADSILKALDGHPALEGDTFARNLIPRNLWDSFRDSLPLIRKAMSQIEGNPRFRHLRGLYHALFTGYYIRSEEPDSMQFHADRMMEDLPYVDNHHHKAIIWLEMSNTYVVKNMFDSALVCRIRYEASVDSAIVKEQSEEVLRLAAADEIRRREAGYREADRRRNLVAVFLGLLLIPAGVVVWLTFNRHRMRQRMRAMKNELELEKAKRKISATALNIEEKDALLDRLRIELSELRREGEIREASARKLESSIKSHLIEHDSEETFRDIFDTVNPGFTDRLRALCPDLADSYIKLACYILMDLDNKKIASLMMIRPESVRQARWRLRNRLNLTEGQTLESFLRSLNAPRI